MAGAVAAGVALLPVTLAGGVVLASVATLAIIVEPAAGLVLLVVSIPVGQFASVPVGSATVGLTEALVWVTLSSWAVRLLVRREVTGRPGWVGFTLALLLVAMSLSLLAARSLESGIQELVKWVEFAAIAALAAAEVRARWQEPIVAAILLTGGIAALHGVYQFLFAVGPEPFLLFGRFMRASGTFGQPNPFAGYVALGATLALGVALGRLSAKGQPRRVAWLLFSAAAGLVMLAATAVSWSRGSWLGLAAGLGVMAVGGALRSRRRSLAGGLVVTAVVVVLAAVTLVGLPETVRDRLADVVPFMAVADVRGIEVTDANFSVVERMAHWQAALEMWRDHPWLGVGIGNYAAAYPRYALPTWNDPLGHAHNYYLNMAAEAGLLGLLSYLAFWCTAWLAAWRTSAREPSWRGGLALGVVGMVTVLGVHSLFDNLFVHGIYLQVAICVGMVASLRKRAA